MKFIGKRKTGLITSALALVFFVAIGVGASFAWFDDSSTSSTVSPSSLQTNGLKTDALVYSGNARHTNDDATAQAPTADEGGVYGYDHAQTGNATSYYLMLDRDGNGTANLTSGDNLQMFTNMYNADDEACYFKLSLKAGDCFKIYNSDLAGNLAESWYGYDRIQATNEDSFTKSFGAWPFEDDNSGSHNIKVKAGAATQSYDIYFDEYSGIWIDLHIDETRSKATSALTGYYVVGDSSSSDSGTFSPAWTTMGGYAMYIDTSNTSNKGIYLGLYLRPGDVFKITTKADSGGEWYGFNEVWSGCGAYSFFADDASGSHNIKCLTTGYYNIYLNGDSKPVSIERYGGSYTSGGNSYTAKSRAPSIKRAATWDNTKLNYVQLQFQLSDTNSTDSSDDYSGAYYYLELSGGAANTGSPGLKMFSQPGSNKLSAIVDASAYVGWTKVRVHRGNDSGTEIWQSTTEKTVAANTKNFFKVTHGQGAGWESIWWRDEGSEERFARVQEYRVLDSSVSGSPIETGSCWNSASYTPVMGANPTYPNYVFDAWYTNAACTSKWTSGSSISKDRNLYAHFTLASSTYKIAGSFGGAAWSVLTSKGKSGAEANTGTITFEDISLSVGDEWKINRASNVALCDDSWWGWNSGLDDYAKTNTGSGDYNKTGNNIRITTAGRYDITLNIDTGVISMTSLTYNFYQYQYTGGASISSQTNVAMDSSTGVVTFSGVTLQTGKYWHIEGPVSTAAWGWNSSGGSDNIQAMSGYDTYFAIGDHTVGSTGTVYNIKTLYAMTCTIEFTPGTNSINVASIALTASQFTLKQSNTVGGTEYPTTAKTATVSGTILTFSNVPMLTGYNYYLDVSGGSGFGWGSFYKNSSYPTMKYGGSTSIPSPGNYFYSSNSNIGVGYGGQYDLQFDLATQRFTTVNLDSLSISDFKISIDSGAGASDFAFTSSAGYVWTKTNLRLSIGAELYIHNDNTTSTHNYLIDASDLDLSYSTSSWSSYFTKTASNHLKALVDCTVSFTFTYDPTDTTADWVITAFTKNTAVITPYANSDLESGMYFVSQADSYECGGANAARMFYGTAENANCVYAYSGLVVSSTSTLYRLKEAYSSSVTTLKEHIPSQTLLNFSMDGTSPGKSGNRDEGSYVQFTRTGTFDILIYYESIDAVSTWTIEAKLTGKTVDTSSEHESKWSLIGRGTAPASALYDGDFTTNRGLPMWCAQGVENPYPCYAGQVGDGVGDTANGKGTTITLLEGDQFALNGSNGLLTPTISATYGTVSSNVVTMKRSGNYYVYAASTSGFTIEFASEYDSRSDTDRSIEASESPSQYGAPISYTKMDGARVKRASGNSLSFASGINASLMDATSDGMIKVFVELRHINQTGGSGNLTATLSSVAAPTGTKYTVKTYNNAATPVQSALGNIESLRNATTRINNQNFANGTMFSSVAVANLASSYFSLATIIEIDIPVTALSVKNSSGTTATFNLAFTIGLNYVEA